MFSYALFLLSIFPTNHAADVPPYRPDDVILLSCGAGATARANDRSGRTWISDERSRYSPPNSARISNYSPATATSVIDPTPAYATARIFRSQYKYSFPLVSPGYKFLRLYFHPDTYDGFNTSQSLFTVTANGITLLRNFSASLYSLNLSQPSFSKEFIVNGNQRIDLTFSPNPNSFAFINGIEIVSLPENLYYRNEAIKSVPHQLYYLPNDTALENLYRLNVGGADVKIQEDTGMFRYWSNDQNYIFGADYGYTPHDESIVINFTDGSTPAYTAPNKVYTSMRTMGDTSKSLEWVFPVDSGFSYLLRFHFYEFLMEITKTNDRVFTIMVNNEVAELEADVIFWGNNAKVPIFKDYIVRVEDDGHRGKKDLRLSLFPNKESIPKYLSAFLNGLEIFKLSDSNQSLAAANPEQVQSEDKKPTPSTPHSHKINILPLIITYTVVRGIAAILVVIILVSFLVPRKQQQKEQQIDGSSTSLPTNLCRRFSLGEIKTATGNFDNDLLIGKGGFGNVYKGFIDDGTTIVAVKRLNTSSKQGAREFITEIGMLSRLRNVHLVSLIGYCIDNGEMILVYEYMVHGTLRDHLYNSDNPPLTWKQHLQICLGAARGLDYLHTGAKYSIIHRDVKSSNILLDENWVAKVSDFGLSKVGPTDPAKTYVTTVVKGSFGYIDPEYRRLHHLTEKSDVYSLGVVLFEVLCNRPAVDVKLPLKQANLAAFAKSSYREGTIDEMIDCTIRDQIAPECLCKFVETGIRCIRDDGRKRPEMVDVVWSLEFALKLQLEAEDCRGGIAFDNPPITAFQLIGQKDPNIMDETGLITTETGCSSTNTSLHSNAIEIFTDLANPTGR